MTTINKICISRIDKLGDMILSLPAIKGIKIANQDVKIYVLASKNNAKVLENIDYIDKIIIVNTSNTIRAFIENIFLIRKLKFEYFLNLSPTFLSYLFCFFSKSKIKGTLIFKSRYKKNSTSKILTNFFSVIFCNYTYIIDRYKKILNNEELHQTKMIFNLVNMCKIPVTTNTKIDISLPQKKLNIIPSNKSLITIHLTARWINNFYKENKFLELISDLPKDKYIYVLTTDETTKTKFKKVFDNFKIINNKNFVQNDILQNEVTILENLDFNNLIKVIYSSSKVITPECGCTHLSAACKVPVLIIYDSNNLPEAIYKEYHPWKSEHIKLVFDDNNLNKNLIENL